MKSISIVVGLGRSGIGAAKLLNSAGKNVIVVEELARNSFSLPAKDLQQQGIRVELGKPLEIKTFEPWLNQLESVIVSPGVPWDHSTLNALRKLGIKVQGEMALAWQKLNHIPWIAITGTNGKTTVTHLLQHVLEANHFIAPMGGNMGKSASELAFENNANNKDQPDWLVMELSSYQLEAAPDISPKIGIWTNLTPDHLERHRTMSAYRRIKRRLLDQSEIRIFNADDEDLALQRPKLSKGIWISSEGPGSSDYPSDLWINEKGILLEKEVPLFDSSLINLPGKHNLQNLLMVTAAARQAGLSAKAIARTLSSFKGVPHRLERIGKIKSMEIFNDSKATNFHSATMGLKAVKGPSLVLAGGQIKEGNSSNWLNELQSKASGIILFGSSANELKALIQAYGYKGKLRCCEGLSEAIKLAIKIGQETNAKSLLLSPACASFDQYENFEERGDHFKTIIHALLTD